MAANLAICAAWLNPRSALRAACSGIGTSNEMGAAPLACDQPASKAPNIAAQRQSAWNFKARNPSSTGGA
jgi:hypothetical protein